ncbi:hypothetical protein C1646_687212, partial [Rhizophagus diaphanus]
MLTFFIFSFIIYALIINVNLIMFSFFAFTRRESIIISKNCMFSFFTFTRYYSIVGSNISVFIIHGLIISFNIVILSFFIFSFIIRAKLIIRA